MLNPRIWKAATVMLIAALSLSACGKKTFKKLEESSQGIAGQYNYIKPKLDLVIFQDNSDSIANAMAQLKPQLAGFLSSLDTNWEYRVVVLPLLGQQSVSSKVVLATNCTGVPGTCFLPSRVNEFNALAGDSGWINSRNSAVGNVDLGFQNMNYNINNLITSGFIRSDAALAMMIISNNDDHSGVAYITRPDGATTSIDYNHPTTQASFNSYKNYFLQVKNNVPQLDRMYAVVSAQSYTDCWGGGRTWAGIRYMNMAAALGGVGYDLCQGGLSGVLADIRSRLVTIVQTIEFNYLVFPQEPDPATITVKKNGSVVPNSGTNGWTYAGYRTNQPTSFAPTSGNVRSGYMVQLHGSATLKGTDTYELIFTRK